MAQKNKIIFSLITLLLSPLFFIFPQKSLASGASFSISPGSGTFTVGQTITAKVNLNTNGNDINAAEAVLNYSSDTLQLSSLSRTNLFGFWQTEPNYSGNKITFAGGRNANYTTSGALFTLKFKTTKSGTATVNFSSGRILAADGNGTLNYSGATGATWNIQPSKEATPTPNNEQPKPGQPASQKGANPAEPIVSSLTHPDQNNWYNQKDSTLNWTLSPNTTQIAYSFDLNPTSEPTNFQKITNQTTVSAQEGQNYFHIKAKNQYGESKTVHYRLQIDTLAPIVTGSFEHGENIFKLTHEDSGSGTKTIEYSLNNSKQYSVNATNPFILKFDIFHWGKNQMEFTLTDHAGNQRNFYAQTYNFPYFWLILLLITCLSLTLILRLITAKAQKPTQPTLPNF